MSVLYVILLSSLLCKCQAVRSRSHSSFPTLGVQQRRRDNDAFLRPQTDDSAVLISTPDIGLAVEKLEAVPLSPSLRLDRHSSKGTNECQACRAVFDYQKILQMSPHPGLSLVVLLTWACVLIWLIGTTAQDFFVPPLLYWSERLRMQPEVAGATLLALGNGAPDIFAVSTAASRMDLSLALSEMFGSNMFTFCVTGAAVMITCHLQAGGCIALPKYSRKLLPKVGGYGFPPLRSLPKVDMGLLHLTVTIYLVTLVAIGFILFVGQPSLVKASCLPLLYGIYLMAVICQSRRGQQSDDGASSVQERASTDKAGFSSLEDSANLENLSGEELSLFLRAWSVITFPAHVARWLSIPAADSKWDNRKRFLSSACVLGMLAFSVVTHFDRWQALSWTWQMSIVTMALLTSVVILATGGSGPSLPWFYPLLTLLAQASAICWLAATAAELTALIEAAGFVFEVPQISLGFTAIAWGDALGDMLTCVAMVRSGQARAALMAVFANSVLDDLLGFGLALMSVTSEVGGGAALFEQSRSREVWTTTITCFGFLTGAVAILVMMIQQRGLLPHVWVGALLLLYVAFLASVVKSES